MDRRQLLLAIIAGIVPPGPARAAPAPPRELHLVNAHTGEEFRGVYRDEAGPIREAMDRLSVVLRDFHCGATIAIDPALLDFLSAVMAATAQTTAIVLSAYRTAETNARLARTHFGVAENSQHMYGRALDVHFDARLDETMRAARALLRGGVGWYPQSAFVHLDSGPVRNWELDGDGFGALLIGGGRVPFRARETRSVARVATPDTGTPAQREAAAVSQRIARLRALARAAYPR
jgi:uncharacterized protein YcbK (DUF882 family)